jgi:chromosome transmission fidelity protein 8
MKRVYFHVGENQRLAGEVRKLGRPVAVVRRRGAGADADANTDAVMGGMGEGEGLDGKDEEKEELEVVEIVKYKVVFSTRPEPVSVGE